jgi:HK97 family phage major capsid protein
MSVDVPYPARRSRGHHGVTTNRQDLENLIPIETSNEIIQRVARVSAIEQLAPAETMTTDTKQVPRFGGFTVATVAKGADYAFSTNTQDLVDLIARKIGGAAKIAEEDFADAITGEGTMRRYEQEAGSALAKTFDHACIGTTTAMNGTTSPFVSIYQAVTTTQSTPWGSYTANANRTQIPRLTTGSPTPNATWQDGIIAWLADYEESDFYDEANTFVLASPMIKSIFRGIRDADGNPVFIPGGTQSGSAPSLFGYENFRFTTGARTGATMTDAPSGNPLLVIGNSQALKRGIARTSPGMVPGNPGVQWQRAAQGIGFLSDEAIMKAMMRRAFVVSVPQAVSVLEITPGS